MDSPGVESFRCSLCDFLVVDDGGRPERGHLRWEDSRSTLPGKPGADTTQSSSPARSPSGRLLNLRPSRLLRLSSCVVAALIADSSERHPWLVVWKAPRIVLASWLTSICMSAAQPIVPIPDRPSTAAPGRTSRPAGRRPSWPSDSWPGIGPSAP